MFDGRLVENSVETIYLTGKVCEKNHKILERKLKQKFKNSKVVIENSNAAVGAANFAATLI